MGNIGSFVNKMGKKLSNRNEHMQIVQNPLVIAIGVGYYDDIDENLTYLHEYVDVNIQKITTLCTIYNYDLYPKERKLKWTEKEIVNSLTNYAEKAEAGDYDSIICIFSGYGDKDMIISSDYKYIMKIATHRLFSTNYPSLRNLPRFFIYDCPQIQPIKRDHKTEIQPPTESDTDILLKHTNVWSLNEYNPDYKLVMAHTSHILPVNKYFDNDSYFIFGFVSSMIENILQNKDQFLGDMLDNIQQKLHDAGKMHTTIQCNNHTRYLKFKKNENILQIMDESVMHLKLVNENEPIIHLVNENDTIALENEPIIHLANENDTIALENEPMIHLVNENDTTALENEIIENEKQYAKLLNDTSTLENEIIRNEELWRKYVKTQPQRQKQQKSNKKSSPNNKNNSKKNKDNNRNNNHRNDNRDDDKDGDDDKNGENKHIDDDDIFDMSLLKKKMKAVKATETYKKIKLTRKYALTENELMAVVYYCDSDSACSKMKKAHRCIIHDSYWKETYFHCTNAVEKIYKV
eukprot:62070_1